MGRRRAWHRHRAPGGCRARGVVGAGEEGRSGRARGHAAGGLERAIAEFVRQSHIASMRKVLALLILSAMTAHAQKPSVSARVKQLHALLHEHWEWTLSSAPEFASILGDKRWNDRWSDYSA